MYAKMKAPMLLPPPGRQAAGVPSSSSSSSSAATTAAAATSEIVTRFPAPEPPMHLEPSTFKKQSYHQALLRYCSAPDLALMLQAHTEGTLINRYYRFQVFRDWCAARPIPIYEPYEIEHIRLYCLHIAAVSDHSKLALTAFTAVTYQCIMPPINPKTGRTYQWLASHPCAIKALAIAHDDVKRTVKKEEQHKAPPIQLQETAKLHTSDRQHIVVWTHLGVRWSSYSEIRDCDVQWKTGTATFKITADKILDARDRYITIACTCTDATTNKQHCPMCCNAVPPDYPVDETRMKMALRAIRATFHSPRRTNAIMARHHIQQGKHFNFASYMADRGWVTLATFFAYCVDFKDYDATKLLPADASLKRDDTSSANIQFPKSKKQLETLHDAARQATEKEESDTIDAILTRKAALQQDQNGFYMSQNALLAKGSVTQRGKDTFVPKARKVIPMKAATPRPDEVDALPPRKKAAPLRRKLAASDSTTGLRANRKTRGEPKSGVAATGAGVMKRASAASLPGKTKKHVKRK
ncbi:unnamed protein product [Amoebophrya sp. A25]|nr:unnamed protein product [Amoebophrya sp. A25]|eukprot:GSA25T00001803001.1